MISDDRGPRSQRPEASRRPGKNKQRSTRRYCCWNEVSVYVVRDYVARSSRDFSPSLSHSVHSRGEGKSRESVSCRALVLSLDL